MTDYDAIVVGAGPAGLAAACTLAEHGASVLVLDENLDPGGQYYRALPPAFSDTRPATAHSRAERAALLDRAGRRGVTFAMQACVVDIAPADPAWRLAVHLRAEQRLSWVSARGVVAATGARELTMPFPGWTLPGVMTLGGAQNLYKAQGLAPGRRVVLSGAGPFLWLVAQQLIEAGVHLVAVAEATPLTSSVEFGLGAWRHPALALDAATHWARILASPTPFLFGHAAIAAHGDGRLQAVTLARLDRHWRIRPGSQRTVAADALCVSHALLPSTELTRLAGCRMTLDPRTGASLPVTGDLLQTSLPRLFAAGETRGIAGGPVATLEGQLAGLGLATALGLLPEPAAHAAAARLRLRIARRRRLAARMAAAYAPRPGALSWADGGTTICRCEDVPAHAIHQAIAHGDRTPDLVKSRTRCGMGTCQGRLCGPVLQRMLAQALGTPLPPPATIRQPLKPVPIQDLLHL